jgi:hypothetical protein
MIKTLPKFALLFAMFAFHEAGAQGYSGWAHHRNITLNTSATGADVSGNVDKFPVGINLSAANFDFSQAKDDGSDLRFSTAAGAVLPYQIESWDKAAQTAAVWVKVDVKGNDASQAVSMHWGNPGATSESDGTKVFDKADGWVSAWHLAEKGNADEAGYKDATANAKHGKGMHMTPETTVPGRVGPAANLSHAAAQYVLIPGSEGGVYTLNTSATYSIWINTKSQAVEYQAMFAKGEGGFRIHYFGIATWDSHKGKAIVETCLDPGDQCTPPKNNPPMDVKPGLWWHLALVHSAGKQMLYINGKLMETIGSGNVSSGSEPVTIGNNEKTAGGNERKRTHDGIVDEARILSIGKDANWMKLDYESQRADSKLLKFEGVSGVFQSRIIPASLRPEKALRIYDLQGRLLTSFGAEAGRSAEGIYFLRAVDLQSSTKEP